MFGFVVPVLLVIVIVAAIVLLARRKPVSEARRVEPGIGTVRRLFYYGIAFVALMLGTIGLAMLLDYLINLAAGPTILSDDITQLAVGLALTLVGTPVWLYMWVAIRRVVRQFPSETGSFTRKVYIYLVLAIALAMAALGLSSLLAWAMHPDGFNGDLVSIPLVWGGIFAFHWWVEAREVPDTGGARTLRRLYVYLVAFVSLVMSSVSGGRVVAWAVHSAYDAIFEAAGRTVALGDSFWSRPVAETIAGVIVAGAIWIWHWFRVARGEMKSALRHVHLYLVAVTGAIASVASASILLYGILRWVMDGSGLPAAETHFMFLPGGLAALLVGVILWGYHWAVMRTELQGVPDVMAAARRSYRYIMAAIGLGTVAASLVFLFALLIDLTVPDARVRLLGWDWWRWSLSVALTTLFVGTPLWNCYWWGAQREVKATLTPEVREALSRRIFIWAIFTVAVLATLGGLGFVLYSLFKDALEGTLALGIFRDMKWGLGVVLMAGIISVYHWLVLREDRRESEVRRPEAPPEPAKVQKNIVVVAPASAAELVSVLATQFGFSVTWRRLEGEEGAVALGEEQIVALAERIAGVSGDKVLVLIEGAEVHVFPYRTA